MEGSPCNEAGQAAEESAAEPPAEAASDKASIVEEIHHATLWRAKKRSIDHLYRQINEVCDALTPPLQKNSFCNAFGLQ